MKEENLQQMIQPLLKWYNNHKRDLPWRKNKNPYEIWISEIMLQQTRIEAVKSYYARFIQELPTIHDLANIEEEKLLKLWEGLGYYNRAKNLQKAAKLIEEKYEGKIPKTYQELITLPGIGEYTAGAIASISFNEKVPAVDGNVLRVISRVLGMKQDILLQDTKKKITKLLTKYMPSQAGNFNESLMELGELICIPNGEPNCLKCPLKQFCIAYQNNLTNEIPVRVKKVKRKIEEKTVLIFTDSFGKVAIQKRTKKGVLSGMYELPNIKGKLSIREVKQFLQKEKCRIQEIKFLGEFKHIFTHIEWKMYGYQVYIKECNLPYLWTSKEELEEKYALPTAFKQFL
jgi:A/G-specific adenine glycosylase